MDPFFVRSRLSGWLDKDLSPREQKEVEQALDADPALRAEADHLRDQLSAFRALREPAPPGILARLRLEPPPRRRRPAALSAALGFLTGILLYRGAPTIWAALLALLRPSPPPPPVAATAAPIESPAEAPTEVAEAHDPAAEGRDPAADPAADPADPLAALGGAALAPGDDPLADLLEPVADPDAALPPGPGFVPVDRNILPEPGAPGSAPREDWLHPRTPGTEAPARASSGSGPIARRSSGSGGTRQYLRPVGPLEPGWKSGGDGIAYQELEPRDEAPAPRELAPAAPDRPFRFHLLAADPESVLRQLQAVAAQNGGLLLTSTGQRRSTGPMNPGDMAAVMIRLPAANAAALIGQLADCGQVTTGAQPAQVPEGTVEVFLDVEAPIL